MIGVYEYSVSVSMSVSCGFEVRNNKSLLVNLMFIGPCIILIVE